MENTEKRHLKDAIVNYLKKNVGKNSVDIAEYFELRADLVMSALGQLESENRIYRAWSGSQYEYRLKEAASKFIEVSGVHWTHTPKNSSGEEDWSMANNGGNYAFGQRIVKVDGKPIGLLHRTSAEFDYCEITGDFTSCELIEVEGTNVRFYASKSLGLEKCITQEEFIHLISTE